MLKKFFSYYKPYIGLFVLDIVAAIVFSVVSIFFPIVTRSLIKTYLPNMMWNYMIMSFVFILVIYIIQLICDFIRLKWGHILGVYIETDMRTDLFSHLQKLSFSYYDQTKTGHIMSRITNDLFQITETAHHCPEDIIISSITIIGGFTAMFIFNWKLAFVTIIPFPLLAVYGVVFGKRLKSRFVKVRQTLADVNSTVENSIQGIREVKSFNKEDYQEKQFENSNNILMDAKKKQYDAMAKFHSMMNFFRNLCYLFPIIGGSLFIYKGQLQAYDLITFVLFITVILPPIDRLINFMEQLQQGIVCFQRFVEVMDINPEIEDSPNTIDLKVTEGIIRYENVNFSYDNGISILNNINLTIEGGSTIALVGESGAGKSTLANLVPRFYEVTSGAIFIDNQDIKMISQSSLHKKIGFVQQNIFLFDASIRENLKYGKVGATDQELWDALSAANLHKFVASLPNGLDTQVGEHGARLSGGQKQRLSIARVFLKNPPILIFDEATSALDSESEHLITEAFERLAKGRTSIVIAHRLSTIRNADTIIVIDDGRVIEKGNHQTLIKQNGKYTQLYNSQKL
ncbi:MAG: ABC transporter ATP-binding protein [Spirochaetaceae bacterium]|nr:ABC transporter ATP-binding protein [Spirochaetaceae bacterium]